jgi:hypothetical protein
MMHSYYHGLTLFLHGLLAFPGRVESHHELREYQIGSGERCSKSIEAMSHILSSISAESISKLGWPLAWSAWIAARYILIALHNGFPFQPQLITSFLHCLEQLAKYWQIAGKYWRLLRQAYDEQQNSVLQGGGVLSFVIDQRLATSDLEDRFRIDSFFTDPEANLHLSTVGRANPTGLQPPLEQESASALFSQDLFIESDELWFLNPLNPSSAYQRAYPEFF